MGAWRYCDECDAAQDIPKRPINDIQCTSCGAEMHPHLSEMDWIDTILDRLDVLEESIIERTAKSFGSSGNANLKPASAEFFEWVDEFNKDKEQDTDSLL